MEQLCSRGLPGAAGRVGVSGWADWQAVDARTVHRDDTWRGTVNVSMCWFFSLLSRVFCYTCNNTLKTIFVFVFNVLFYEERLAVSRGVGISHTYHNGTAEASVYEIIRRTGLPRCCYERLSALVHVSVREIPLSDLYLSEACAFLHCTVPYRGPGL